MKSLFIVNDFPPILGGQSSYYYDLCRAFNSEELIVMAPVCEGFEETDRQHQLTILRKLYLFPIFGIERLCKIILPFIYSYPLIKKEQIQLVHCAHVLSTGVVGLLLKRSTGVRYIVYTHSADILQYQKNPLFKIVLKAVLNNADRVVSNSIFTRERTIALGIEPNKIRVIYPKTDTDKFENSDGVWLPAKFGLKKNKIVLSVNRLVERKGNDIVIKAMAKVITRVPEAVYVIGGHGPYRAQLESLVNQHNLRDSVIFLGTIKNEDIGPLYKACDVFVMVSRNIRDEDTEGFGIAFLEAGACGKPVIGGRSGGVPEAVEEGRSGFLVEPENVDAVAEMIIKLLTDETLSQKLGQYGRERVREKFDRRLLIEEARDLLIGL